jgi:DNA-binding transcriptional LysR family regulator
VRDLTRFDTISMSAVDGKASWHLVGPNDEVHLFEHQPRYVADDLYTLKLAVLAGTGLSFMPEYMCRDELRDGRLVQVVQGWAPQAGVFHAVFPSRRGMAPAVRSFLDFLEEQIQSNGEVNWLGSSHEPYA